MRPHLGFLPDADRARHLDLRMHRELGASLWHLCEAANGVVPFDAGGMAMLVGHLEAGMAYSPILFGDYYQLGLELMNDDCEAAEATFSRVASARPLSSRHQLVAGLADPRACPMSAKYHRSMTVNSEIGMLPPPAEVAHAFAERYRRGLALMDRAVPELAAEVRAIVRHVVCVVGDPAFPMQFDGGSHFQLWGALFLNADFHKTDWSIIEVVAHESAHSLLFGFCIDEPLVFNDDDELYQSPLRMDPRPMDGIYHATFVSARMHWAMSRLVESGLLTEEDREHAERARDADARNFEAGYGVVAEHGRLSDLGAALMAGACDYMEAACA